MTKALAWPASLARHAWEAAKMLLRRLLLERDYHQFTRFRVEVGHGIIKCEFESDTMLVTPQRSTGALSLDVQTGPITATSRRHLSMTEAERIERRAGG